MQGSDRFPAAGADGAASADGRPAVRAAEAATAAPGDEAPGGAAQRRIDTWLDEHDRWNAHVRGEGPLQRADRAYGEILQEIRVAQTGVQILFAFLLTLAFTARFRSITATQRDMYVLTLMLCAAATALLIAPAACHRVVYRRRLKRFLVRVANRLALAGLVLLLLAMISALLLILDVVTGLTPALLLAAAALVWFMVWWFALPLWSRLRSRAYADPLEPGDAAGEGRPAE